MDQADASEHADKLQLTCCVSYEREETQCSQVDQSDYWSFAGSHFDHAEFGGANGFTL